VYKIFLFSVIFLLFQSTTARGLEEIYTLQDFYKSYKDIEGRFIQKSFIKELNKSLSYEGTFYVKGKKMYLDYKGKRPQKVYVTESEIIIYQPKEKTAFRSSFDESKYGQTPLALIKGLTDIKNDFQTKKLSQNVLSLKPLKTMGNIEEIKVYLSTENPFPISKILLNDKTGNHIEIIFTGVKVNEGIRDAVLMFNPPSDVTIINQ